MKPSLAFGIYDPGCPPRPTALAKHKKRLGTMIRIVSWYQAWGSRFSTCRVKLVEEAHRHGAVPLITWEPWRLPSDLAEGTASFDQPEFTLKAIAGGCFDTYIRSWALKLAAARRLVYLRPMHEMNGNWYPWGGTVNGNHPQDFTSAWHRLRRIFGEEGADNVRWVWCPYARSVPEAAANALEHYFPGVDSVDWLALDGYNWGTTRPWARWESFTEVFGPAYDRLIGLSADQPVMIAEVGCAEEGGDKARWIREALQALPDFFRRVRALVWFDIRKECDWRIDSTPESLTAFRSEAWRFASGSTTNGTGRFGSKRPTP